MTATTWKQKRGRLAERSKHLPPDHPELTELRRDIRAERLEEHVAKVMAERPPLTGAQLESIVAVLRAGARTNRHTDGEVL